MTSFSFCCRRSISISKFVGISVCLIYGLFSGFIAFGQEAIYKEEIKTIKTYPYSDPNPIPAFAISKKFSTFYPYFFIDGYTRKVVDKDWKVITLENDYIKVMILPGVGGKVWGAIEKTTGTDFIYLNHVLKFRSIGIRGPWTSGGIEHNFGLDLGHAPWTASDVDYLVRNNSDGSVSCIVGGIDLASRTEWRVDIRLPKDKAYFETNSIWYNPGPLHDAYLSWENTAYKATDDLQFYFPGTHYLGHGGDAHTWPLDEEGHNLSIYKENNFGSHKSYHVVGKYPNWFGGYYHDSEFGTGHWSPYDEAPGKKIWIWSLARSGAIWEDLLTDTDGQYIEAQSGVKFNQASPESGRHSPFDQLTMRPFYSELKSEVWFPVKETGGIVDATRGGTLNLVTSGDSLLLSFCPNIPVEDTLILRLGKREIYRNFLSLEPLQVWKKSLKLPERDDQVFEVSIGDDLLNYSSDARKNEIDRPLVTPPGQSYNSAEQLFRVAEDMYSMRAYDNALKTYQECLKKEPGHAGALTKVAEIFYRKTQYREGLKYARKVLENNTYDGGANFIYGLLQKETGNLVEAEEAYSVASRSMEYRSAAYVEIAGLHLQNRNYHNAAIYAIKALDYNRYNITAYEYLSIAYRKLNRLKKAEETLGLLTGIDPLYHFVRFEQYLLNPSKANLTIFTSAIRNELPFETYLELAMTYVNQGLNDEALKVLQQSPEYPTVNYWLAYLNREHTADKSAAYLKKAIEMSPHLVFPFRHETIPVLEWAEKHYPSWKNNYYLGLIYWNSLRKDVAKELFKECGDLPDFAPFYVTRGVLFKDENDFAAEDFKKAVAMAPDEWRTWNYQNDYLDRKGQFQQELENTKKAFVLFRNIPEVGIDYARALINSGEPKEALKLLKKINVLPYEGAREGYGLYELANLLVAMDLIENKKYNSAIECVKKSELYPEHLGTGKPYEPDVRLQDYMAAYCEHQSGNLEKEEQYYRKIYEFSKKHWHDNDAQGNVYLAVKAYRHLGKDDELQTAMEFWHTQQDSLRNWRISAGSTSPEVQWVLAKYSGKEDKFSKLEGVIFSNPSQKKFKVLLKIIKMEEKKKM